MVFTIYKNKEQLYYNFYLFCNFICLLCYLSGNYQTFLSILYLYFIDLYSPFISFKPFSCSFSVIPLLQFIVKIPTANERLIFRFIRLLSCNKVYLLIMNLFFDVSKKMIVFPGPMSAYLLYDFYFGRLLYCSGDPSYSSITYFVT